MLCVAASTLITACATSESTGIVVTGPAATAATPATTASPGTTGTTATTTPSSPAATASPSFTGDYNDLLAATVADLDVFWAEAFPAAYNGRDYRELRGGVQVFDRRSPAFPSCGGQQTTYSDIRDNAFYCADGQDYIAYDNGTLAPRLVEEYGAAAMAVVLAHEWGHAIQFRARVNEASIIMEQQADCFAGAWTARAINERPDGVVVSTADLPNIIAALISVRDTPGTTAADPQAHGSGFDRVSAFQDGYTNTATACARYPETPPVVIALPFSEADYQTQGNLPYTETIDLMTKDLDLYFGSEIAGWQPLAPGVAFDGTPPAGCTIERAGFCPGSGIAYDATFMQRRAYRIGDFAVGYLVGQAWAEAALVAEGSTLDGTARSLRTDCYVGAWTKGQIPRQKAEGDPRKLSLSPGDLDEGVQAVLTFGDDTQATPFERLAAFRTGLLSGRTACA